LISDRERPMSRTGIVTHIPARGPAAPTSNRIRRSIIGDFILINAPKVPINEGAGMKYGKVTSISCFLDMK